MMIYNYEELKEKQNRNRTCSFFLCGKEISRKVVVGVEDEEFELKPACGFHLKYQLELIGNEDKKDIVRIEEEKKKESKLKKKGLEIEGKVILEEKLNKGERLQNNYQPLREMVTDYIKTLKDMKNQPELELYPC